MQVHTANVEAIDRTLRRLGPGTPPITAVHHLGDVLEIHLAQPAPPPEGVTALDPSRWSVILDHDTNVDDNHPVPALAFLGSTDTEALAVNLVHARPGVIQAHHTCPVRLLRALSLDLVRAPWSQHVTLHLAGFGSALAQARTGHVAYRTLEDTLQVLTDLQTDQPRSPHILMCAHPPESTAASRRIWRLLETNPWLGALIVTAGDHNPLPAGIHIDADHGIVTVDKRTWRGQLRAMSSTEAHQTITALPARTGSTAALDLETAPITTQPDTPSQPRLQILGPVTLTGVDSNKVEPGRLHTAAELAAYLHLHPKATTADVTRALWPHARNPTQACASTFSRLRRLLGNRNNPTKRPDGTYKLDLASDLDEFRERVRRARTRSTLGEIDDLTTAVDLIRGEPLHDPRTPNRYHWATHARHELIAEIIHAIARLTDHQIHAGKPRLAYTTARNHLYLHPTSPTLWQPMLHALSKFAPDQLTRALDRYTHTCTQNSQSVDTTIITLAHQLIHQQTR